MGGMGELGLSGYQEDLHVFRIYGTCCHGRCFEIQLG